MIGNIQLNKVVKKVNILTFKKNFNIKNYNCNITVNCVLIAEHFKINFSVHFFLDHLKCGKKEKIEKFPVPWVGMGALFILASQHRITSLWNIHS